MREAGYSCPEDVSVVGFDDAPPFAKYLHPSLTTICQPMYEMGLNAGKLIVEKLEGKKKKVESKGELFFQRKLLSEILLRRFEITII